MIFSASVPCFISVGEVTFDAIDSCASFNREHHMHDSLFRASFLYGQCKDFLYIRQKEMNSDWLFLYSLTNDQAGEIL